MERDHSPDNEGPDKKRRRKVLSCLDCRRRKVQCDRGLPACSRCQKAGKGASCAYEDDSAQTFPGYTGSNHGSNAPYANLATRTSYSSSVTVSRDVWDDLLSRLLQQERTIERIRDNPTDLTTGSQMKPFIPSSSFHDLNATNQDGDQMTNETMLFRGKAFKTQFHGPTDPRSTITHAPEAFVYAREVISRSPALVRVRRELWQLRSLRKIFDKAEGKRPMGDLLTYLPDRHRTMAMVETYLESIDSLYGFMHVPTFRKEYEAFCENPASADEAFLVIVLLMIACVECLMEDTPRLWIAVIPMARQRASRIVETCESWLKEQSQKHTTLAYFQIHCMLLIAKEINSVKMKKRWIEAGDLLRLVVAAGMHRDTDLLQTHVSCYDREMRRRIWSFAVELDLHNSIDRGMPAVSLAYPSDCGLPLNLHDEDFDQSTTEMPRERPESEATKMSYLRYSSRSRSLRARLTNIFNQPHPRLDYEEVIAYTQEIEQHLSKLPQWSGKEHALPGVGHSFEQTVALLRMQLENFLLILHTSAARVAPTETGVVFSRSAFLVASRSIIRKLSDLSNPRSRFLLLYRQEILRVFVAVGHLRTPSAKDIGGSMTEDDAESMRPLLAVADAALEIFEKRIMRSGNIQYTFSFAMYDLLRSQLPVPMQKETTSGCDRIHQLFKFIMENQEPGFAMKAATYDESQSAASTTVQHHHDPSVPKPRNVIETLKPQQHITAIDDSRRESRGLVPTQQSAQLGTVGQDAATAPINDGAQSIYGGGGNISGIDMTVTMADLLDMNFDDWMLYNDPFWPSQGGFSVGNNGSVVDENGSGGVDGVGGGSGTTEAIFQ